MAGDDHDADVQKVDFCRNVSPVYASIASIEFPWGTIAGCLTQDLVVLYISQAHVFKARNAITAIPNHHE